VWNAFGPYLYKNDDFVPRYILVPNAILLAGDEDLAKQLSFWILQNIDVKNTVVLYTKSLNELTQSLLEKFSIVVILKAQNDYEIRINQQILSSLNETSNNDFAGVLKKLSGKYKELKVNDYKNNRVALELYGESGWIAASERFAHFPGWKASMNAHNLNMFKANNAFTGLRIDGEKGELVFGYYPHSYKKGRLITLTAFFAVILYLGFYFYKIYRPRR
jgi:uncharacterized membrane protein YfhO